MKDQTLKLIEVIAVIILLFLMGYLCFKIVMDQGICVINPLGYAQSQFNDSDMRCVCFDTTKMQNNVINDIKVNWSEIKINGK